MSGIVYHDKGGLRRTMMVDGDKVIVRTQQIMDGVIDNNAVMRELHPKRSTNKLIARGVPITVYEQSIHEGWDENDWKKWLNDPDNAAFRVWEGRV